MRKFLISGIFGAGLVSGAESAQDLEGWCYPANDCIGAQIPLGSGTYDTCEETCTLTNPVSVRDMEATLFDVVCRGDWMEAGSMSSRLMIIKQASDQTRMFAIGENSVTQLERCDF
ncbi:MAG: hypothetical protein VX201_07835 [Pseudomonadota bacterium]|nr:hypothetical protein [Pseudomonadota bacterium]